MRRASSTRPNFGSLRRDGGTSSGQTRGADHQGAFEARAALRIGGWGPLARSAGLDPALQRGGGSRGEAIRLQGEGPLPKGAGSASGERFGPELAL